MIRDIALAAQANSKEGDTFFLITQRFFSFLLFFFLFQELGTPNQTQSSDLFCSLNSLYQNLLHFGRFRSFIFGPLNFTLFCIHFRL